MLHNNITARERAYNKDIWSRTDADERAWHRDAIKELKRTPSLYRRHRYEQPNAMYQYSVTAGNAKEMKELRAIKKGL